MLDSNIAYRADDGSSEAGFYTALPITAMELANAVTTQSPANFPALTTYMSQVEQTRDSVAPMLNGRFWNLLPTPGNTAAIEYEQILVDIEAGFPTEGSAQTEADPTWNKITLRCHQINSNGSFTNWADWGTYLLSLPDALRESIIKDVLRKANKALTDGAGGTNNPLGLITEVDQYENAPWSITPGDYSILKDKGADATTNPFTFADLGDLQDLMDDGQVEGDKMFFMAHRRFFGNIRSNLFNTNPGVINAMWPLFDLSKQKSHAECLR